MKRMKKFLAVMLAAIMVMSMTTSVFADVTTETDSDGNTIYYEETTDTEGNRVVTYYDDEAKTTTLKVVTTSSDDSTVTTEEYSNDEIVSTTVVVTDSTAGTVTTTVTDASGNVTTTVTDTASGTSTTTYALTITGVQSEAHTYEAYQIFSGTLSNDGTTLSDIQWGTGVSDSTAYGSYTNIYAELATISITNDNGDTIYPFTSDTTAITENGTATALTSASGVAAALTTYSTSSNGLGETFADIVAHYLTTTKSGTSGTATRASDGTYTYTISGLSAGYYLIKDAASALTGEGEAYTDYIVQIIKATTVEVKEEVPSVTKTVTDTNGNESDVTSASAGDSVSFTLTATMPSSYADYDAYKLVFHDTLTSGLASNNDVKVTVNHYEKTGTLSEFTSGTTYYTYDSTKGYVKVDTSSNDATPDSDTAYYTYVSTEVKSGYTVTPTYTAATGLTEFESGVTYYTSDDASAPTYTVVDSSAEFNLGTTYYYISAFTVTMYDTNALYNTENPADDSTAITVKAGYTIEVTYTATVNSKITAGTAQTNKVYLEYSNDPNEKYDGTSSDTPSTGKTEEDIAYVYTFDLSVTKTDESEKPLSGASFSLYKKVTLTSEEFDSNSSGAYYTISGTAATVADSTYSASAAYYVLVEKDVEAAGDETSGYIATFNDLGEGTYALVESVTPDGYNTMDAVYFVVEATYDDTDNSVKTLVIKDTEGNEISTGENPTFSAVSNTGKISTTIKNVAGSKLPTTGGIGTTIFYVVGMILVLGAAVILVTRRRMAR